MKICTLHPTNPEARFRIVSVKGLPVGCPRTCPLQAHGDLFAAPSRSASAPSIAPIRGLCVWVLPKECHRCLKWSPSLQGEKCQCDEKSVLPLIRLLWYWPLPASSVTLTSWYAVTSSSSIRNRAMASLMTCSVVMELETGMVNEGLETLRRRANTRITPLSCSLSLKPKRTAGRRPSFRFSFYWVEKYR